MTAHPDISTPFLDEKGAVHRDWLPFIIRKIASISKLSDTATNAEIIAKVNEVIDAAKTADYMEKDGT